MNGLFDVRGFRAVMYKELRQIRRNPFTLALALGVPLMQLLILGYAINTTVEHIPSSVFREDRGRAAQAFIDALAGSRTFEVVREVNSREALRQTIVSGQVRAAFDIPPNFTAGVLAGRDPAIGATIDGSDAAIAQVAYGSAIELGGIPLRDLESASPPHFEVRPVVMFNPAMRSANFFVPGLIGIVMQNITIILTALAIVGERERGTLDQLLVTPIGVAGLMLGKLLPYVLIAAVQFTTLLLAMWLVFGVPIHGNLLLLSVLSLLFLLPSLGLGLLISTIAQTQIQSFLMSIFILLPSVLLSGAIFERSLMPLPMQIFGYVIPLTFYLEILRGIIIRGAGIGQLWGSILPMVVYGVATFVLASLRFARTTR